MLVVACHVGRKNAFIDCGVLQCFTQTILLNNSFSRIRCTSSQIRSSSSLHTMGCLSCGPCCRSDKLVQLSSPCILSECGIITNLIGNRHYAFPAQLVGPYTTRREKLYLGKRGCKIRFLRAFSLSRTTMPSIFKVARGGQGSNGKVEAPVSWRQQRG